MIFHDISWHFMTFWLLLNLNMLFIMFDTCSKATFSHCTTFWLFCSWDLVRHSIVCLASVNAVGAQDGPWGEIMWNHEFGWGLQTSQRWSLTCALVTAVPSRSDMWNICRCWWATQNSYMFPGDCTSLHPIEQLKMLILSFLL